MVVTLEVSVLCYIWIFLNEGWYCCSLLIGINLLHFSLDVNIWLGWFSSSGCFLLLSSDQKVMESLWFFCFPLAFFFVFVKLFDISPLFQRSASCWAYLLLSASPHFFMILFVVCAGVSLGNDAKIQRYSSIYYQKAQALLSCFWFCTSDCSPTLLSIYFFFF